MSFFFNKNVHSRYIGPPPHAPPRPPLHPLVMTLLEVSQCSTGRVPKISEIPSWHWSSSYVSGRALPQFVRAHHFFYALWKDHGRQISDDRSLWMLRPAEKGSPEFDAALGSLESASYFGNAPLCGPYLPPHPPLLGVITNNKQGVNCTWYLVNKVRYWTYRVSENEYFLLSTN